jgi:hypothetical protein
MAQPDGFLDLSSRSFMPPPAVLVQMPLGRTREYGSQTPRDLTWCGRDLPDLHLRPLVTPGFPITRRSLLDSRTAIWPACTC